MNLNEHGEECPGGFVPVNNDFDEGNKDTQGNRAPDNYPDPTYGDRIARGDAELRTATLYITAPEGVTQGNWYIGQGGIAGIPKVKLWMWKDEPVNKWVDVGTSYFETDAEMPLTRSFIIEGIAHSNALRDTNIYAGAGGMTDTVFLSVVEVDTDVDSDNNNGFDDPARTIKEEWFEEKPDEPGKIVSVNDGDADGDGIPDFADGYGLFAGSWNGSPDGEGVGGGEPDPSSTLEGVSFVPYILDLRGVKFAEDARIGFLYSGSDPALVDRTGSGTTSDPYVYTLPQSGSLRLWTKTPMSAGRWDRRLLRQANR